MDTPGGWGLFAGWLLKSSAQAALLVVLVLVVQWLLRRWLAPRWRYFLWWLVVARLLMPVSLPGPASIFNWVKWNSPTAPAMAVTPIAPEVALPASPAEIDATAFEETTPELPPQAPVTITAPAMAAPARPPFDWRLAVMWLWLAGVVLLGARLVWSVLRLRRELRTATPVSDPAVLSLLDECRVQMQVRDRLTLLETPLVNSPALCGFWRPRLLLPPGLCGGFSASQLRFIFLHELAHVRRHDIAVNWLITLLQLLHWFNPLVWLAFSRLRADRELACDALALSVAAPGEQHAYGQTIIRLLEGFARPSAMPGLVGILEDKNQMKRRIRMIAQFRRPGRWAWLSGIAAAILGIACLTDAQTPKAKEEAKSKPAAAGTSNKPRHSQEYSVSGRFVYQVLSTRTNYAPLYRDFKVEVRDCEWKVTVVLVGNRDFESINYSFEDGTLRHYPILAGGRLGSVTVESCPVPRMITSAAGEYAWLAFASGCYLKGVTNNSVFSLRGARSREGVEKRYQMPCQFELAEGLPNLPVKVEYWQHGLVSLTDEGEFITNRLGRPSESGPYLTGELKSHDFTTIDGWSFPKKFEYRGYRPSLESLSATELQCRLIVQGVVTNIEVGNQKWVDDLAGKQFLAWDLRIAGAEMRYVVRSNDTLRAMPTPVQAGTLQPSDETDTIDQLAGAKTNKVGESQARIAPHICQVVGPDGKPVDHAAVGFCTERDPVVLKKDRPIQNGVQGWVRYTDAQGKVEVPVDDEIYRIVAVHDVGFGEVGLADLRGVSEIKLRPWGRVEGTWRNAAKATEVGLESLNQGQFRPYVFLSDVNAAPSDAAMQGRFSFDKVPPGEVKVCRLIKTDVGRWSHSHEIPISVRPGETTQVELGNEGVAVKGRFIAADSMKPINLQRMPSIAQLSIPMPDVPRPPASIAGNPAASRAWQAEFWESEAGRAWLRKSRTFALVVAPDGSFTCEDIPSGEYVLRVTLTPTPFGPERPTGLKTNVVVARAASVVDEPIDLGTFVIPPPKPKTQASRSNNGFGQSTPDEIAAQRLNKNSPQLTIQVQVCEVAFQDDDLPELGRILGGSLERFSSAKSGSRLTNAVEAAPPQVMTEARHNEVMRLLNQRSDVDFITALRVVTMSGRQARINIGTNTDAITGQTNLTTGVSVEATVFPDGTTIDVQATATIKTFIGYNLDATRNRYYDYVSPPNVDPAKVHETLPPAIPERPTGGDVPRAPIRNRESIPIFRLRQTVANATVWDGQTMVLSRMATGSPMGSRTGAPAINNLSLVGRLFSSESFGPRNSLILIFITPTIIDPAGNRVHSEKDLPFARTNFPPQSGIK